MADGAPVCNLPNIGQVPALQAGRMYPALPRANDLPSLINLVNLLSQLAQQLVQPGLTPFKNNLAPATLRTIVGTPGLNAAAGADGSAAQAGKDGKDGKKAKDPKYKESGRKSYKVKVEKKDDEETFVIMRRFTNLTMTSQQDGKSKIEWQGDVANIVATGILHNHGQPLPAATDATGAPFTGTKLFDRTTVEETGDMPTSGWGEGKPEQPFEPGLMQDCVGIQWGGGLAFEFED